MKKLLFTSLLISFFIAVPLLANGAEPPELSGPPIKKALSSEERELVMELGKAIELSGDGKNEEKNKEAIEKINKIIELNPEYSDAYFVWAMTYFYFETNKDYQKIIDYINKAIQLPPFRGLPPIFESNSSKYSLRAKVYIEMGNYQQGINDLETAVNLDPHDAISPSGVNPDEMASPGTWGKRDFDELIGKFPKDFRGYIFRGLYYQFFTTFDKKNYAPAYNDYKKSITLNPKSALGYYLLGRLYYYNNLGLERLLSGQKPDQEDTQNAITSLSKAIELNPKLVEAYRLRADIYLYLENYQYAIKDYDKAIELDSDIGGAYYDRGLANQNLENYYEAINDFGKAIRAKKQIVVPYTAYESRANAYVKLGILIDNKYYLKSAIEDYTKTIELQLESIFSLINMTRFREIYPEYDDMPGDDLVKKLHDKFYPNWKYEDFAKSFREEKNIFTSASIAELYDNRGDAYLNSGYYKKAIDDYSRAVRIWPDYKNSRDRWKFFAASADGSKNYIDIKDIPLQQNKNIGFWVKHEHNKPKDNVVKSIVSYELDCSSKMLRSVSFTNYDTDGHVIGSGNSYGWSEIIPESIGEVLYAGWCREGK